MAVMVSVGFWAIFGAMAWRDYRSLAAWPEATCTILGGRLSAQATTRTGTRSGTDTTNYVPVLGLRYAVDSRETFSSGYKVYEILQAGARSNGRARILHLSHHLVAPRIVAIYRAVLQKSDQPQAPLRPTPASS